MRIMDRYLFWNFLFSYLACFVSMVGLYVIIDLFSNVDEFLEDHHANTIVFIRRIVLYYGLHSFEYFSRLSPIITQIAAMTTLASLHRHNEIVALLAAGIPTRRALRPILIGVIIVIALDAANREFFLPRYSEELQRLHEDIEATHVLQPSPHIDSDHSLIIAEGAHRENLRLTGFQVSLFIEAIDQLPVITAPNAYYRQDPQTGDMGWLLENPSAVKFAPNAKIRWLDQNHLFLVSDVTFADMIRRPSWINYAATRELVAEMNNDQTKNPQLLRTMIHNRLMQPILNLLLVLMGIPFVLQWERKNLYTSVAISMGLSTLFYVVSSVSAYLALYDYLSPLTAAWVPVFVFTPVAVAFYYRIGT